MAGGNNVSLTTAFIDLSTFDEIEAFLYGGLSVNRFRKTIRRSAWFTIIAAQLNKVGTTGDFDSGMQAVFSRAGDYVRDFWMRVELPEIRTNPGFQACWTRNIGHNLIDTAELMYNDLVVNRLTSCPVAFDVAALEQLGNHCFRQGGGPTGKKFAPEKIAENHPRKRGNIFFRFWDPCCSGAQKGPCGASLLACCLLLAY